MKLITSTATSLFLLSSIVTAQDTGFKKQAGGPGGLKKQAGGPVFKKQAAGDFKKQAPGQFKKQLFDAKNKPNSKNNRLMPKSRPKI